MKKIKSSLEIAMEKFGVVRGNDKELEKLDEEKYLKAAATLGNSFLEKKTGAEQIRETLERYPENIRSETKNIFAARLMEALSPSNTRELLEAISFVKDDQETKNICIEALASFLELQDWLQKEKAEHDAQARSTMLVDLAREGFRGSALAGLNIRDAKKWREKTETFSMEYDKIIDKFKKQIQNNTKNSN